MESRWYIPPGRKLEETKIKDRGHALHINKTEWDKITGYLNRKQLMQEAIDKEKEKIRRMKEECREMSKNWENSIENLGKKEEKERERKNEGNKNKSMQAYNEMRKDQEEQRSKFVAKVRKDMYMQEVYPKALNGALLHSEVLYERDKQIEFNKMIEEHNKEDDAMWARKLREKDAEEKREDLEKEKQRRVKQITDRKFFLNQIAEKEAFLKKQNATESEEALQDAKAMEKEMRELEAFQREQKKQYSIQRRKELLEFMEIQAEEKRQADIESQEIDEIINIHAEAKERILCLIKKKTEDLRREEIAKHENMGLAIVAEEREKMCKEIEIARNILIQKAKEEEEKEREKQEKIAKAIQEMKEDREHVKRMKEKEEQEMLEMKKWEMLNRVKQQEAMKEYDEEQQRKKREKILDYRRMLNEQKAEKKQEEEEAKANDDEVQFNKDKIEREDKRFLEYGEEVLEFAKSRGRTTYPIKTVIDKYKKENRLNGEENKKTNSRKDILVKESPGQRAHYPQTDPTYGRCRCRKNMLYN